MKWKTTNRWIASVLTMLMLVSLISVTGFAETGSFAQNFNSNTTGVDKADFTYIKRPADLAATYTDYVPDGTGDGALLSSKVNNSKAKVSFGKNFTDQVTFEADFRLEGKNVSGSTAGIIKFFDGFSSNGKNLFMVTSGICYDNNFSIRPVYTNASGAVQVANLKVDGNNLAYQTWHHLKIVMNTDTATDAGTIEFYVNDVKIAEGYSRANTTTTGAAVGNLPDFSYFTCYQSTQDQPYPFLIDNVSVKAVSGILSDKTDITSTEYIVDGTTLSGVAQNTTVADFKANVTLPAGATAELYSTYTDGAGTVRTGTVAEGDKYVVTAEDGKTKAVYTIVLFQDLLPFEQNFDTNLDQVTLSGFTTVLRPENGAIRPFTPYTPDGTKNGAAQSSMENNQKLKIDFGGGATGKLVFEGQFRYEAKEAASSGIKFFDIYDKSGKCLLMFTIGNTAGTSFTIRPVHKLADGTGVTSTMGVGLAFGTWHTLRVEFDTNYGYMKVMVNGNTMVEEGYPWGGGKVDNVAYVQSYHSATGHTIPFLIDSVKLYENTVVDPSLKDATATSTVYTVGEDAISAIPTGTTATQMLQNIYIRTGATATVYSDVSTKTVRVGEIQTGDVLHVISPDQTVTKDYTLKLLVLRNEYYVAPNGDDAADGSLEHPFATLQQAKNAVRTAKASGQPITVYVKAGTYPMTDTLVFDANDSGTADAPITYQAYGDGKVIFKGSKTVAPTAAKPVTDQAVLGRLTSSYAKGKLMQIDLKAAGVTEIPAIPDTYGYSFRGYQPLEVYVNGKALQEARWPNGDTFLKVIETDGKTSGFMVKYPDDTNRAALWNQSIAKGEVFIAGGIGHPYAVQRIRVASMNTADRSLVVKGATNYVPSTSVGKFFFTNLLEEIDLPGESYLDRTTGILYFYPNCDMSTAEIEVSELNKTAISMANVSHITFKDLTFTYTRANIMNASKVSHITIDGCEISHTSSNAITFDGTDSIIQNCHIYDLGGAAATGGITLSGGDRKTLTSSGNKILNNRMHLGDRVYQVGQSPLIRATGVGHLIEHNDIYDGTAYVVQLLSGNDIQLNYNEIYDAVRMSSDAGAVTWGRDTTLLGFELKYNYFHNMGNPHGGVGQQAIFYDDGATGPYAYGNIFYRGSLTANEIPSESNNYAAVKTNGGRYGLFENNIFVESFSAIYFQPWANNKWWKYVNDVDGNSTANMFQKMTSAEFFGEAWKNHYKDTQWAPLWQHFDQDSHNQAISLKTAGKTAELDTLAAQKENNATNQFKNNVVVNVTLPKNSGEGFVGNGVGQNTYRKDTDQLQNGNSMFTKYGEDFKLTAEGLSEVKKTIPAFQNIPTEQIGVQPYQRGSDTLYVGSRAPVATNLMLSGSTKVGGILMANYNYSDPDGDPEGISEITWYYSDTLTGTYETINDALGKEMVVTDNMAGGYIKCMVVPYDRNMMHGDEIWSEPIQIAKSGSIDKDGLRNMIAEAKQFVASVTIGEKEGEYPQSAVDTFNQAIQKAEVVLNDSSVNQNTVNNALKELTTALNKFKLSKNESSNVEYMTINEMLADTDQWHVAGANGAVFENGSLTLSKDYASYLGGEYQNKLFSFQMKVSEATAWAGIYFRQADGKALPWSGNSGFMLVFKPDVIELQTRNGGSPVMTTYPNDALKFGEVAEVTLGAYDISATDVKLVLMVNGKEIISEVQQNSPLAGKKGLFGAYISGGNVTLSPAQVDKTALKTIIDKTEDLLSNAIEGTDYGQYRKAELDALKQSLATAKEIYESEASAKQNVDKAITELEVAFDECYNTIGTQKTFGASASVPVVYGGGSLSFTIPEGINAGIVMDASKVQPEIQSVSPAATMTILEGTKFSKDGWDGSFALPVKTTSPEVPMTSAIDFAVAMGANGVTSNRPVRIVIPGVSGRVAASAQDGKWSIIKTKLSQDTEQAFFNALPDGGTARIAVNGDLVIWTTESSSLAIYSPLDASPSPIVTAPPSSGQPSNGGATTYLPGASGGSSNRHKFLDITGHWAEQDIVAMFNKGIVSGITETAFEPDRQITRAEFATLLVKGLNVTTTVSAEFQDVDPTLWYTPYINAAASIGLISGYDGFFRPNDNITREEMAVVIAKAESFLGREAKKGGIIKFSDASHISAWAYESVDQVASAGIISGNTDGTFDPKNNATRAECASIVKRVLDRK